METALHRRVPHTASGLGRATAWLVFGSLAGTAVAAERAIDQAVVVPATLAQAWAAWTTAEGITSFFAPEAVVEPRVGGAFHIHMDPLAAPGAKGADDMRFMAVQPLRMLSFDWNAPPHLPEARAQRTFVTLRFEAVSDTQTRVTLHHTGWGDGGQWDAAYAYFERAWPGVLSALRTRFETGQPRDWSAWMQQLRTWHAPKAEPVSTPAAASAAR